MTDFGSALTGFITGTYAAITAYLGTQGSSGGGNGGQQDSAVAMGGGLLQDITSVLPLLEPVAAGITNLSNSLNLVVGGPVAVENYTYAATQLTNASVSLNQALQTGSDADIGKASQDVTTAAIAALGTLGGVLAIIPAGMEGIAAGGAAFPMAGVGLALIAAATVLGGAMAAGSYFNVSNVVSSLENAIENMMSGGGGSPFPTGGPTTIGGFMKWIESLFNTSLTDPLVIDLSGNGVQLIPIAQSNAYFDLHDTGFAVHTGWVGPDTGLLVQDNNGNGKIDNITELFGNSAMDGFSALKALDTNHDGVIDAQDPGFANLKVWVDANGNGVTDPGELYSLADLDITFITLTTQTVNQRTGGNVIAEIATYTRADGTTGQIAEAYFDNSQLDSKFSGSYELNPVALTLPNLRGYGTLPDLYIAMSLDPTLLQLVQSFTNNASGDSADFASETRAILYRWAGVDTVDPKSRGAYVNAQELGVLEKFVGETFSSFLTADGNPANTYQDSVLTSAFQQLLLATELRLIAQGPLASVLSGVGYDYDTDSLFGTADVSAVASAFAKNAPSDPVKTAQYWQNVVPLIDQLAAALCIPQSAYEATLESVFAQANLPYSLSEARLQDVFLGNTGNDKLIAFDTGPHFFDGGPSTRYEQSFGGGDTFVFDSNYADLEISELDHASAPCNVLKLGPGISESDVFVRGLANGNLVLSQFVGQGEGSMQIHLGWMITLDMEMLGDEFGVQEVQFADGTTWNRQQLLRMSTTGTIDDDTLYGTLGADIFDGKGGNDYEQGLGGGDTFIFSAGYGKLEIAESDTSDTPRNVLQLGPGISESAITVKGMSNGSIVLTDGIGGDQITLDSELSSGGMGVQVVQFASGTIWTREQLLQMATTGTPGNDMLYGTTGADVFDGKGGNDYEQGLGGGDTFIFNAGYGKLEIAEVDFGKVPNNVLQLGPGISASSTKVKGASNGNLILTDGVTGDQITLDSEIVGTNFGVQTVHFADGTTWSREQLIQLALTSGTPGNDSLYGTSGADLFDGKGGNDYEYGGGGGDTFIFNSGYGRLEIYESDNSASAYNVLQLGAGISPSAVAVRATVNSNLILTDGVTGDQITLDSAMISASMGVQAVRFSDGTCWTRQQLLQMATTGTTGNDSLYGTPGADIFDGQGGNDYEQGGGGGDTFIFNPGYGKLEIAEVDNSSAPHNVLQLGAGISPSMVSVKGTSNSALVLTDGISGDQITLDTEMNASSFGVQLVQFADGTTWTRQQMLKMATTGTTGNDSLYGTPGADIFDGQGGNDYEQGGGGGDTFIFNPGYGKLEIAEVDNSSSPHNVLQLGAGISPSTMSVKGTSNAALVLADGITGDQITLDSEMSSSASGVQLVQFADGTTWTRQQMLKMATTGTAGNDTLYGTIGVDVFDGKGGNDVEIGLGGGDTFIFNAGYGKLEIQETDSSSSPHNVLQLGAGITASSVTAKTGSNGNIVLTDGIAGDQITLDCEATANGDGVQSVQFSDGTTWTRAQLLQMATTGVLGSDRLYDTSSAVTFENIGSADIECGAARSDTYSLQAGYGQTPIVNGDNSDYVAGRDWLTECVNPNDIWLRPTGLGNLPISGGCQRGLALDRQFNQLVQTMAAFSGGDRAFDSTPHGNPMLVDSNMFSIVSSSCHR
jgi:Ca2+-binding RTX toxin-like protein